MNQPTPTPHVPIEPHGRVVRIYFSEHNNGMSYARGATPLPISYGDAHEFRVPTREDYRKYSDVYGRVIKGDTIMSGRLNNTVVYMLQGVAFLFGFIHRIAKDQAGTYVDVSMARLYNSAIIEDMIQISIHAISDTVVVQQLPMLVEQHGVFNNIPNDATVLVIQGSKSMDPKIRNAVRALCPSDDTSNVSIDTFYRIMQLVWTKLHDIRYGHGIQLLAKETALVWTSHLKTLGITEKTMGSNSYSIRRYNADVETMKDMLRFNICSLETFFETWRYNFTRHGNCHFEAFNHPIEGIYTTKWNDLDPVVQSFIAHIYTTWRVGLYSRLRDKESVIPRSQRPTHDWTGVIVPEFPKKTD